MRAWNFAYRNARKGNWETFVRDRDRFNKKITCVGMIILPILEPQHRKKILEERFEYVNEVADQKSKNIKII